MALGSALAVFQQLVNIAAADLGVTIGASPAQDSIGLGPPSATTASIDLNQGCVGTAGSLANAPSLTLGPPVGNEPQQITSIPNAAQGTLIATHRKMEMKLLGIGM